MGDIWRDYVVRKYVRARSAEEAIRLSEEAPVIEVNEMKDNPKASNQDPEVNFVGFHAQKKYGAVAGGGRE